VEIVKRGVGIAIRVTAHRILGSMATLIPAPAGRVEAAHQGRAIVDHQELLVLRGPERVFAVVVDA
jgi:hypothetical protein